MFVRASLRHLDLEWVASVLAVWKEFWRELKDGY